VREGEVRRSSGRVMWEEEEGEGGKVW